MTKLEEEYDRIMAALLFAQERLSVTLTDSQREAYVQKMRSPAFRHWSRAGRTDHVDRAVRESLTKEKAS